ncbi:ergothioneine biosynthesis protein EgtB [Actinomadura sp. DC4]|uniref:ergothioneine biosynthesis protein EgtB n=1 Tax=Actinomadura sp. DC4 TaxID=3055069 RepID=UPI0025B0C5D9|nr:ergothioneine biosynthesis protein EgtB [Actinomadura sp. DC4]MDN3356933.1 ergothioneine biosynthesis protein EgtB [Actinomadura sp. DC4]
MMDVKERIIAELTAARDRSFGLTVGALDDPELTSQVSPLMSPLVWDLAHIGNYEEQWLLRAAAGATAIRADIDDIYDAFEHPRAERPSLPLLTPAESRAYITTVRDQVIDSLEKVPFAGALAGDGFVYHMVIQHEHQHDETMLATHQLRKGAPALLDPPGPSPAAGTCEPEVLIPGGPFLMGTTDDPWAYDNERPGHWVEVPSFHLDTTPVGNAAYAAFVEAGGYRDRRWWHPKGWEWRSSSGKEAPGFWHREGGQWLRRRLGRVEPVPMDEPVQHVNWYEADAYARWAGRRLPTEAEWEKAASWDPVAERKRRLPWGDAGEADDHANLGQRLLHPAPLGSYPEGASAYGVRQLIGDVWEWTSTGFDGYPGFRSFPYKEYSEVFFGGDYKVLKGGSWATHALSGRATFRNWDYPIRRQIFAGFRCARDA